MTRKIAAALVCLLPLPAQSDGRKYSVSPCLWLPTISVDSARTCNPGGPLDGGRFGWGELFFDRSPISV